MPDWRISLKDGFTRNEVKSLTPTAPGGLADTIQWELEGSENCVQMRFQGRNDRLGVRHGDIVELFVDGGRQFYGFAHEPPSNQDPDKKELRFVGGEEKLKTVLMDGKLYRNMGVYAIVRDILARLLPPYLFYSPQAVSGLPITDVNAGTDSGPILSRFYAPTQSLYDVLQGLIATSGRRLVTGVDNSGTVFFRPPNSNNQLVNHASRTVTHVNQRGADVVTESVLRIVANKGGKEPDHVFIKPAGENPRVYTPVTVVKTIHHGPSHDRLRQSRATTAPSGVSLTKDPDPNLRTLFTIQGWTDAVNALDPDPNTFAYNSGTAQPIYSYYTEGERIIGWRGRFHQGSDRYISQVGLRYQSGAGHDHFAIWTLSGEIDSKEEYFCIFPPDVAFKIAQDVYGETGFRAVLEYRFLADDTGTTRDQIPAVNTVAIYDLKFIAINEDLAYDVSAAYINAEGMTASPAEYVIGGQALFPTPNISVSNHPASVNGSQVIVPVEGWEYMLSVTESKGGSLQTKIKAGAGTRDMLARAITQRDEETARSTQEALLAQLERGQV